jgi:uncharacterized protein
MPTPNDAMADQARQGLELRREWGRGGTEVGVARARDISNKADLSMETVRRMRSYFARHGANYDRDYNGKEADGGPNAFTIAWKLWGGNPAREWANSLVEAEQEDDERTGDAAPVDDERSSVVSLPQTLEAQMANAEIRALSEPVEIREEDDGPIRVSGYAAVFGQETNIGGMFTEVIEAGAFASALERQDDVVFLVNHDGLPLARTRSGTLRLTQDDRGLFIESELDPSDPDVRAIVPKMRRGDLDKMSFAFIPTRQEWDDSGDMPKRSIQDLQLYDVSIVTTPAYDGTEIGLRSLQQYREEQKKTQAARRLRMKSRLA